MDIKIVNIKDNNISYSAGNLCSLSTGDESMLEQWIKNFYNQDGGGFIHIMSTSDISVKNKSNIRSSIAMAVSVTNSKTKEKFGSKFTDVKVKSLDISPETGSINLNLEFKLSEQTVVIEV